MKGDKVNVAHIIDGCADHIKVPNIFVEFFAQACLPNSFQCFYRAKNTFLASAKLSSVNRCVATPCSTSVVEDIISKLKKNMAPSLDGLTAEHIINAHPIINVIFTKLINLIIKSLNMFLMLLGLVSQFQFLKITQVSIVG